MHETRRQLHRLGPRHADFPHDECLPAGAALGQRRWVQMKIGTDPEADFARRVCNYIAGMTDLYALTEHRRIFDSTPDLR